MNLFMPRRMLGHKPEQFTWLLPIGSRFGSLAAKCKGHFTLPCPCQESTEYSTFGGICGLRTKLLKFCTLFSKMCLYTVGEGLTKPCFVF